MTVVVQLIQFHWISRVCRNWWIVLADKSFNFVHIFVVHNVLFNENLEMIFSSIFFCLLCGFIFQDCLITSIFACHFILVVYAGLYIAVVALISTRNTLGSYWYYNFRAFVSHVVADSLHNLWAIFALRQRRKWRMNCRVVFEWLKPKLLL